MRVVAPEKLRSAIFLRRENRFAVRVRLVSPYLSGTGVEKGGAPDDNERDGGHTAGGGSEVLCHLPNSGRLSELLIPGARCLVWSQAERHPQRTQPARKTAYRLGFVEILGGRGWASVDATLPNALVAECLHHLPDQFYTLLGLIYPRGWQSRPPAGRQGTAAAFPPLYPAAWQQEVRFGHSRIDFLLNTAGKLPAAENCSEARTAVCAGKAPAAVLLEVKSVTLVEDGLALFPDSPTARGHRHLELLLRVMQQQSMGAAILFVVQREDATCFAPNWQVDPVFARLLQRAVVAGLKIVALGCRVNPPAVELQLNPLPVRL